MTEHKLLREVREDRFFGFVHCDISLPEHLREKFASFTGLFKNIEITQVDSSNVD